jgi:ribose-phosphate pyrophosphokinase
VSSDGSAALIGVSMRGSKFGSTLWRNWRAFLTLNIGCRKRHFYGIALLIIPGPASKELAQRVSESLGIESATLESKIFPDGDSYFRIDESVVGQDVAIIQSTYPPQDQNLIQLFLLVDGLRDLGCGRIHAVVPYLAYMRQDKRFLKGEMISAQSILKLFSCLQIESLMTIDIHNKESLKSLKPTGIDLSAMPLLTAWIRNHGWKAPLIVAPDKGATQRAETVSRALGTDYVTGMKTRDRKTGEVTAKFDARINVKGRFAVIVDDTIARGDTVIKTAEILLSRGATEVAALCSHGLFLGNAVARIRKAGVGEIISTDTIPTANSKISVAPLIADYLRPLTSGKAHG